MGDLTEHFSRAEFRCKCGCGAADIQPAVVDLLERCRVMLDHSMTITSGLRCAAHNRAVGGAAKSSHVSGWAADVAVCGGLERYQLVAAAIKCGARQIEVCPTWIHLGMDPDKPISLFPQGAA